MHIQNTDPIEAADHEAAAIANGFDRAYLIGRVQELIAQGQSSDDAILGICEGHELSGAQEQMLRNAFIGFELRACAPVTLNRYGERGHSIDDVIALLQQFKAAGARDVQISDGYYSFAFNARFQGVPNFDAPRTVILRPVKNTPDADGVTRETGGALQPGFHQ